MSTAAQTIIEEQYLNVVEHSETTPENQTAVSYRLIENDLFRKVAPFYYKQRIRLSFTLSQEFKPRFVMLRGLIEFHRPKELAFTYNRDHRTFEADIHADELEKLRSFLFSILQLLTAEIRFRQALKIALDFEAKYKVERDSVYEMMKRTTGAVGIG